MKQTEKNNSPETSKKEKSLFVLLVYWVVLFVIIFAIVIILSILIIKIYIKNTEVEVPNVIGLTTYEALDKLKSLKLYLKLDKKVFDNYFERGYITQQYPLPKTKVKINSVINVMVSMGSEYATVPDVRNKDLISAGVLLRRDRLDLGEVGYYYSNSIQKNNIISQYPLPGEKIVLSRKINALVSLGPEVEYYKMPDLKAKTLEETKLSLNTYGLILGNISRKKNQEVEEGLIFEQSPLAGLKVARGDRINVTISSGFYASP